MRMFLKVLIGSAGLAAIAAGASPAAAQSRSYGGYNQGGVVGALIDSVLGGDRYGAYGQGTDRTGVDQCARAAEAQVSGAYRSGRYGAYNQGYGNRAVTNARVRDPAFATWFRRAVPLSDPLSSVGARLYHAASSARMSRFGPLAPGIRTGSGEERGVAWCKGT